MSKPLQGSESLFWDKVDFKPTSNGCWNWKAYRDRDGYGLFTTRSIRGRAARLAYLFLVGDRPQRRRRYKNQDPGVLQILKQES